MRAGKVTQPFKSNHDNVVISSLPSLIWSVIAVIGEQPPSSMTPVILESKSGGLLVIGGSGGSMITSAVALVTQLNSVCILVFQPPYLFRSHDSPLFWQSLMNRLWLGMSLKEAIAAPIVFVDSRNNVNFEDGFDKVRFCPLIPFCFTRP